MSERKTSGFTLVELLIVLGIIVLLVSILLPAINRAREQARRVQCLSNIRQLTMAWLTYASEHKGRLCSSETQAAIGNDPNNWTLSPLGGPSIYVVTCTFAGLKPQPACFFSWLGGGEGVSAKAGVLWPYLRSEGVYMCPDDPSVVRPTSYQINGLLAGRVGMPTPFLSLSEIRHSATTFVFIEGLNGDGVRLGNTVPNNPSNGAILIPLNSFVTPIFPGNSFKFGGMPGQLHKGVKGSTEGTGISFADGHAIFWQYSDPRVGDIGRSLVGTINGSTNLQGEVTKITAALSNSSDLFQLEAWSGGPVPPGAVQ